MKNKYIEPVEVIEYLSVDAPMDIVCKKEDAQKRYIGDYARGHKEIRIVGSMHRCGLNMHNIDIQWAKIAELIGKSLVEGVIVANMAAVSRDVADAGKKIGMIVQAGGRVFSVDEGEFTFKLREDLFHERE